MEVFDRVIAPVHDIAVSAFQRMIDRLSGFACPTLAQNVRLVEQIMLRADRFGLGLYFPTDDGPVRVRLYAVPMPPALQSSSRQATVVSGRIRATQAKEPGELHAVTSGDRKTAKAWNQVALPPLIVARSKAEAEKAWEAKRAQGAPVLSGSSDGIPENTA